MRVVELTESVRRASLHHIERGVTRTEIPWMKCNKRVEAPCCLENKLILVTSDPLTNGDRMVV